MKVGLVLDDTLDTPDGVQQYVLRVGAWLSARGHEVHYLVGNTLRTDIDNIHSLSHNLHVRFNGNRMSMPLPTARRKLRTFLQVQQFEVLHVQVPYSPLMAGQLLGVVPPNTAIVGTFHILPYSKLVTVANRGLALLNHYSAKRFDSMLAVSQPAADFARQVYGYRTKVIPNPVELAHFDAARSTDSAINIVFLGRLVARKGAKKLLEAVAYLREHQLYDGAFQVWIGGKGQQLAELEHYIQAHQLQDMVHLSGFISETAKADFLARADLAVYPSLGGESFGIVLLEGMAAARGVVLAGDNPGYASVMEPFPEQLVDPYRTRLFAEKLAQYLNNPVLRGQAAAAQKAYVQRFDINLVGKQLLAVYDQALQSRRRS